MKEKLIKPVPVEKVLKKKESEQEKPEEEEQAKDISETPKESETIPEHDQEKPKNCQPKIFPNRTTFTFDKLKFTSDFDSGNMNKVEQVSEFEYNIWVANDCQGTVSETTSSTWFYFQVEGVSYEQKYIFTIKNINLQYKIIKEGLLPVYKALPTMKDKWKRIEGPLFGVENSDPPKMQISFSHFFVEGDKQILFAYTFPWS